MAPNSEATSESGVPRAGQPTQADVGCQRTADGTANQGGEEARQREISELRALAAVGERLAQQKDLPTILEEVMCVAQEAVGAEAGSCLLLDNRAEYLVFEAALGERADQLHQYRVRLGDGIAGWVAAEGQPAIVADASSDPRFTGHIAKAVEFAVRDVVCVPLKVRGEVFGVLELLNSTRPDGFDSRDADFLTAVATQVAAAIDRWLRTQCLSLGLLATVECLASAFDPSADAAQCHPKYTLPIAHAICHELDLSPHQRTTVELVLLLHDVGKMSLESELIHQPRKLTERERAVVSGHPIVAALLLESLNESRLKDVVPAIRHHHEWVDGRGYPGGLSGDQIPLASRIVSVVHAFAAMTEGRPYQPARSREEAIEELCRWAGTQFDAEIVEALVTATAGLPDD